MSTVFITGASRGIGKAIALHYAQAGWNVAFTYVNNKDKAAEVVAEIKNISHEIKVEAYQLDLQQTNAIDDVIDNAIFNFGSIEALINNAAIIKDNAAVLMSNEEWDDVIAVNLSAQFYVTRALLMHMLGQHYGRIIFISSMSAYGSVGQVNYAAAKAGLEGLSLTLAKEYGRKGITSNIVSVGYVPTEMTDNNMNNFLHEYWIKHCPVPRLGNAQEIATMVFHLTQESAGFITGENIRICGGMTYPPAMTDAEIQEIKNKNK